MDKHAALALTFVALVAAGCVPPGELPNPAADIEALEATTSAWAEAFNAGDAAAVAALYTEDGVLYPPQSPPVKGRAAIQEFWQGVIDEDVTGQLRGEEVVADGDLAYKVGAYTLIGADGEAVDDGHYVEIRVRRDGAWLLARDIWNSDRPLELP